jgi:hypothetical protein
VAYRDSPDHEDLNSLLSEQRHKLMDAEALESDFDLHLAFLLQLEEALADSLTVHVHASTSTSASSSSNPILDPQNDGGPGFDTLLTDVVAMYEQEIKDRKASEAEMRRIREDLDRRIHDARVAREIQRIPEEEWTEWGNNYEKPFGSGEGSSNLKVVEENDDDVFKLYTKGLVSEERVRGQETFLAGIGVAICDPRESLLWEVRKPLVGNGMSKVRAHAMALIEGLNAALALDLKRITFYCDYFPLYQFVSLSLPRWFWRNICIVLCMNYYIWHCVYICWRDPDKRPGESKSSAYDYESNNVILTTTPTAFICSSWRGGYQ